MSGGAYDYVCFKISEITIRGTHENKKRMAFQKLLTLVGEAMHDIEWVDSGDKKEGSEDAAIDKCLSFLKANPEVISKAEYYDSLAEIFQKNSENN